MNVNINILDPLYLFLHNYISSVDVQLFDEWNTKQDELHVMSEKKLDFLKRSLDPIICKLRLLTYVVSRLNAAVRMATEAAVGEQG